MYVHNWEIDIYEDQWQPKSYKVNISLKKKSM